MSDAIFFLIGRVGYYSVVIKCLLLYTIARVRSCFYPDITMICNICSIVCCWFSVCLKIWGKSDHGIRYKYILSGDMKQYDVAVTINVVNNNF